MAEVDITILDTQGTKPQLVEAVRSLHDRNGWKIDSWWTVVREDGKIPNTYLISQTNGEDGGYNPGRARVVETQIWCGRYSGELASALEQRGIPYTRASMRLTTDTLCAEDAQPIKLN